jgi:iron complex transport system substrate-binding protein
MLANALALGVQPVGSTSIYISSGTKFPPYLEDKVDEKLELIGTEEQPNLEKIALLKPDLILGFTYNATDDQLSQIAPTVLIDWNMAGNWKEHLEFVAQTLGKTAEAKQLLEDYNRRIEQFKTAIGDRLAQFQVSLVNGGGNAAFLRSDVKDSFAGAILNDVGLQRPPAQNIKGLDIEISLETIPQLDGDAIFIMMVSDDKGSQVWNRLQANPLWSQLEAVKQDRVYLVDYSTWRGVNILAAYGVIDDLFKYLVKK